MFNDYFKSSGDERAVIFKQLTFDKLKKIMNKKPFMIDLKGFYDKTTAEFKDGVLKVTLKRAKPVKKKKGVKVAIK